MCVSTFVVIRSVKSSVNHIQKTWQEREAVRKIIYIYVSNNSSQSMGPCGTLVLIICVSDNIPGMQTCCYRSCNCAGTRKKDLLCHKRRVQKRECCDIGNPMFLSN